MITRSLYFKNKDLLKSDIVLISDTSGESNSTPSITTGLRGISYMEITLKGPNRTFIPVHMVEELLIRLISCLN